MANTIMSAKNSFEQGLIMDFSPDNTQANCLTSALNATLLTFNGNEMQLQNDMGNGRVETAYLPEGYIPVGTCEFGDIVYIVSYNPLINKSQIGCFPSPERNISSEELGGLQQSLSWKDFQEGDDTSGPTGKIKSKSVKKIIYGNTLNPGDKYIIYSSDIEGSKDTLSDYGANGHNILPRLLKIHVVAIEESGKINYLDSSVKWYDNGYYISQNKIGSEGTDIDEYRDLVTSNYSIFQSKVSGKLALLAELESIDSFNCSYTIDTIDTTTNNNDDTKNYTKNYTVNFNVSWETKNKNINPNGIIITESTWPFVTEKVIENENEKKDGIEYSTPDSTPNNKFYYPIKDYKGENSSLSRTYKPELFESSLKEIHGDDFNDFFKYFLEEYNYDTVIKAYTNYRHILPTSAGSGSYYINPDIYYDGEYKILNSDGTTSTAKSEPINDDIVNNYFHKEVIKPTITLENVPYKTDKDGKSYYHDLSNFVWNYTVAPTMPYGILEDMAVSGSIDFSKIGSGLVDLVEWRYYNDGNISTLKWGLEAYPEDNKKITKVAFEFYDNQGVVGTYVIKDKVSFSGSFTEVIQLGPEGVNPKLTSKDVDGKGIEHPGEAYILTVEKFPTELGEVFFEKEITDEAGIQTIYYSNDAGVLYPNLVYLVKIYVFTAEIDTLGNIKGEETKNNPFIRFLWTNNLMNSYYYNNIDYVGIKPELTYSLDVSFKSNDNFYFPLPENDPEKYIINNQAKDPGQNASVEKVVQTTLGGMKQIVDTKEGDNVRMGILPCLDDSYNTFTFNEIEIKEKIKYDIYFADQDIEYSPISLNFSESEVIGVNLVKPPTRTPEYVERIQKNHNIDNLDDWFTLIPNTQLETGNITYQKIDGTIVTAKSVPYTTISASDAIIDNGGVPLVLKGQMVSRIAGSIYENKTIDAIVYKPAIQNSEDFLKYNITSGNNTVYFQNCLITGMSGDKDFKCNFGTASCDGDYGDFWLPAEESRVTYKGSAIKAMDIGTMYKDSNIDVGPYSLLSFFCFDDKIDKIKYSHDITSDERDGFIDLRTTGGKANEIRVNWRSYWQPNVKQSSNKCNLRYPLREDEDYPNGGRAEWPDGQSNHKSLNAFVAKTIGGKYILFNNFSSSYSEANKYVSQRFGKYLYDSQDGLYTFAQMLLSVLSKLYYRSDITKEKKVSLTSNIITCNNYTATWIQDIITNISYQGEGRDLLAMSGLAYNTYCTDLKKYINNNDKYCDNINIILNMKKTHTTQFQYSLQYNIEYLQKLYNSQNIKYWIDGDITGSFEGRASSEPPFSGTLGLLNYDDNTFSKLGIVDSVPVISINSQTYKNTENKIKIASSILNNLTVQEDIVMIKDTITPGYTNRIHMISGNSGDSKNACWIKLDAKNLFFNEDIFKVT